MEQVIVQYGGELYEVGRRVQMDGSYYFVSLNGEIRCTRDLGKPFVVEKLPKGARKVEG